MSRLTAGLRGDLDRVRRVVAQAEGERHALMARDAELVRDIGRAKGRLAIRGKVERFLDQLQSEAHQKNVGSYERMMTALVQQVLPGEFPIGLDLYTERGLPALNVFVDRPDGCREDVLDDQGGAMTNVISMGLRMIAAVKSRKRKFLVLDEGDCWIAPERVPSFYNVFKDAASKLDVQCLAISHHDVSQFDSDISIARIHGEPEQGMKVESEPDSRSWPEDAPGIRWIRLVNVQAYADETVRLSPGVNALIGPNNKGKSVFVRALRAVFYGEARDSLVRHGEKQATVEIGIEGGRILQWTRQPKRNPVNLWRLLDADGRVVTGDGMTYETGGRTVPEWVEKVVGIAKVENLDIHVAHQKFPVFLLGEPASRRATVLSVGQEASYIRSMIALHKERTTRDQTMVRNGEKELSRIRDRLENLERLEDLPQRLDDAAGLLDRVEEREEHSRAAEAAASRIEKLAAALGRKRRLAEVYARLPSAADMDQAAKSLAAAQEVDRSADRIETAQRALDKSRRLAVTYARIPAVFPEIARNDEVIQVGKRLRDALAAEVRCRALSEAYAKLPGSLPKIMPTDLIEAAATRIEVAAEKTVAAGREGERIASEMANCHERIEALLAETGGACPACGSALEDSSRLLAHAGMHTVEESDG